MKTFFAFFLLLLSHRGLAQTAPSDSVSAALFERISAAAASYRLDTTALPPDRSTRYIQQLQQLGGGFNIYEAVSFKIGEEARSGKLDAAQAARLSTYFRQGNGRRWLDRAIGWIYRQHFSQKELKQLLGFYKSGAGQKMVRQFGVLMLQSLAAAQQIKDLYDAAEK